MGSSSRCRCTATTRGESTADATAAYEYHRRAVKLLQSERGPNLWLFKASRHHNFHLEAIKHAHPDAKFVMTHRDPGEVGAVVGQHRVDDPSNT